MGIGESCYGTVSPSFVAEYFPPERRARALALYSMAIPLGSALGYVIGGFLGHHWGWRTAFLAAGLPGAALTLLAWRLKDPRGEDGPAPGPAGERGAPGLRAYAALASNRSLVTTTLAMAAMTFGMGALAVWMPTFFIRRWGLNPAQAGTLFGLVLAATGIVGSFAGGWLADWALARDSRAYFLVSGIGLLLAFPLGAASLAAESLPLSIAAIALAEVCAFLNMGPLNAAIVSVVPARLRSMAFAANIFIIHALGDAASPALVGLASDRWGLKSALIAATAALGLAGLLCLWGMRTYDADAGLIIEEERARA